MEEIIVDGIDVSKCRNFCKDLRTKCAISSSHDCKVSNNCYYKQLQRKTAECKELKKKVAQTNDKAKDGENDNNISFKKRMV